MRTTRLWALAWALWLLVALGILVLPTPWASDDAVDQQATHTSGAQQSATIPCLSYAPFRRPGHTPMDPGLRITDEQLLEDLRILARITHCIRVYGTSHGQDRIPALAATLGMKVVVGAWISRDRRASEQEVAAALAIAHAHPDVVRMIIIGNEVLLRQERSPDELAALLKQVRSRSPVPVAYADVWEFWLRHADVMAPAVDVVAIHVLPYWEDEPVALEQAVDHVVATHAAVRQALPDKTVWLAETGWPSAGRQRGPALPGLREQALFVRQLSARMASQAVDFNLIEGFDQPWKRQLEGGMGGAWGILDAQGRIKDTGGGALPKEPMAAGALAGAGLGLMGAWLISAVARRRMPPGGFMGTVHTWDARLLHGCAAATAGLLLGAHGATVAIWLRTPEEWAIATVSLLAVSGVCVLCLTLGLGLGPGSGPRPWRSPPYTAVRPLLTTMLFLAAWNALTLVFDGRYRPVSALLWAAPAVVLWWTGQRHALPPMTNADRMLGAALLPCALALLVIEGAANAQAVALAGAWCVIAAAVWIGPHEAGSRASRNRISLNPDKAHNKAASADRSAS